MNSRERVIKAVEFKGPDRVPNGCYWLPGAFNKYDGELENLFLRYPKDFHQFVVASQDRGYPIKRALTKISGDVSGKTLNQEFLDASLNIHYLTGKI